jgi:hypothetical protein
MRISNSAFILAVLFSASFVRAWQAPAHSTPAPSVSPAVVPAPPPAPSALLRPSLDTVQQTVSAVRLERWKKGTVREEADANIGTILRNLQDTLPSLLREADAAPGTLSKMLPVSRNIDALYDVLLRVVEGARVSAPAGQVADLQEALTGLGKARNALDNRMLEAAAAEDKQIKDLRSTLQAQSAIKCPAVPAPAPACPTPAPAKTVKKKVRKPPATTPQTPPAQAPAAPATPKS